MENTQIPSSASQSPQQVAPLSIPKKTSCTSMSTLVITAIFVALLCSALVFFWYRSASGQAQNLLKQYIDDMRLQRDQVLDQRADLKVQYDALLFELKDLRGERDAEQ